MDVKLEPFVNAALAQVGAPYIWAAKGDFVVRDGKVLRRAESLLPMAFDCSGLVNWARMIAGGDDVRGNCNAQRLMDESRPIGPQHPAVGRLRFYGRTSERVTHVGIVLSSNIIGHGLTIDASGGDETTLTLAEANRRGARVQIHFDHRLDLRAELWPSFVKP